MNTRRSKSIVMGIAIGNRSQGDSRRTHRTSSRTGASLERRVQNGARSTMSNAMACNLGSARTLNQFALVSYLPEPLAQYLDDLRRQLTPDCKPHAHLT